MQYKTHLLGHTTADNLLTAHMQMRVHQGIDKLHKYHGGLGERHCGTDKVQAGPGPETGLTTETLHWWQCIVTTINSESKAHCCQTHHAAASSFSLGLSAHESLTAAAQVMHERNEACLSMRKRLLGHCLQLYPGPGLLDSSVLRATFNRNMSPRDASLYLRFFVASTEEPQSYRRIFPDSDEVTESTDAQLAWDKVNVVDPVCVLDLELRRVASISCSPVSRAGSNTGSAVVVSGVGKEKLRLNEGPWN